MYPDEFNSAHRWLGLKYSNSKWIDWIGRTSNIKSELGATEIIWDIEHDFNQATTPDNCLLRRPNNDIANILCSQSHGYACTQNTKSWIQRSEHDAKLLKLLGNPGNICHEATQNCKNTIGSYECECKTGYEWRDQAAGWSGNECIDIDECNPKVDANHNLCDANSLCVNTIGSYKCSCNLGYYWNETTSRCEDYDECSIARQEWTMEGAICPADEINNYFDVKDKCKEHKMVPLTVKTKAQGDQYMSSTCADYIKDTTLDGHWLGLSKNGRRQWTDVFENAVYYNDLQTFLEFGQPHDQHCLVSWHEYVNNLNWIGGDYPCSINRIGYVCIKPWADALANPDPFDFSDHKISFSDFTAVETKCKEKGLYPMSLTSNMDLSKFLTKYKNSKGREVGEDYNTFWLLKQEHGIYKDWVGRVSDVAHGTRHGIANAINDGATIDRCLVAWDNANYDTDDQGCENKYYSCAKNTQPYSRRSEYNAEVLEWLKNPGNNCNLEIASCVNSDGSFTCSCKTGTLLKLLTAVFI